LSSLGDLGSGSKVNPARSILFRALWSPWNQNCSRPRWVQEASTEAKRVLKGSTSLTSFCNWPIAWQ
jgi:hypothetical protein